MNEETPKVNTKPITTGEVVEFQNRQRFNPLRSLNPTWLSLALDNFNAGSLRDAAMLWERILERDDTLPSVDGKRRDEVKSKTWRIERVEDADEKEAARHEACLTYFYTNATAVNAFDRNERGEFETLLDQMMSAPAMKYAVHHLVWKPTGKSIPVEGATPVPVITAEFEFVPLYFFENTTGQLRYDPSGLGVAGKPFAAREWMTTCGRGLMFAGSIAYMFKRLSFQDWVNFNERYAQGKVIGRTPGSKGSPEGVAMAETVSAFTGDMSAVIYNDQGGDKSPIEVLEPKGTASVEAFSQFVERQDRKLVTLWRGGDLSTMSAGTGKGQGASLQGDETKVIVRGDTCMCGGSLRRTVDRWVIELCFGKGVEPLAYLRIDGEEEQKKENTAELRESAGFLADRGVKVDAEEIASRLCVPLADNDDVALGAASMAAPKVPLPGQTANAAKTAEASLIARTVAAMGGVEIAAVQPVAERIAALIRRVGAGDISAVQFAEEAEAIADEMPELLTPELVADVAAPQEGALGAALLNGIGDKLRQKSKARQRQRK